MELEQDNREIFLPKQMTLTAANIFFQIIKPKPMLQSFIFKTQSFYNTSICFTVISVPVIMTFEHVMMKGLSCPKKGKNLMIMMLVLNSCDIWTFDIVEDLSWTYKIMGRFVIYEIWKDEQLWNFLT